MSKLFGGADSASQVIADPKTQTVTEVIHNNDTNPPTTTIIATVPANSTIDDSGIISKMFNLFQSYYPASGTNQADQQQQNVLENSLSPASANTPKENDQPLALPLVSSNSEIPPSNHSVSRDNTVAQDAKSISEPTPKPTPPTPKPTPTPPPYSGGESVNFNIFIITLSIITMAFYAL